MPSPSPAEAFLLDFHRCHPGASSLSFACGDTGAGQSSYDLLVDAIPPSARFVMDLGCGDGYLLARALRRRGAPRYLAGIDLSRAELRAAQLRLSGRDVRLLHARAQSLPVSDAACDHLTSHMALMLMDDVALVVSELARVTRPGATLALVVGGDPHRGDAFESFVEVFKTVMRRDGASGVRLGDPRVRTVDGLAELFSPSAGFSDLSVDSLTLRLDGDPDSVWQMLSLTYGVHLLSAAGRRALEAEVRALLRGMLRPDGTVPCGIGIRRLLCRRT